MKFVRYIEQQEDMYDEGEEFTPEQLMTKAANKDKTLMEDGNWNAPSAEEQNDKTYISFNLITIIQCSNTQIGIVSIRNKSFTSYFSTVISCIKTLPQT